MAKGSRQSQIPGVADELLWHKVYEEYINSLPPAELGTSRDVLIERHLRIVGRIAGQIAWRRTPHSFGIWAKECQPNLSHVGLVYELTAFGVLGLIIAAERYRAAKGWAFSTYANFYQEVRPALPRRDYQHCAPHRVQR